MNNQPTNHCPAVLLIIFNRPDLTERVFLSIRAAKPRQLFIAADGPRAGVPGEIELCQQSRKIANCVDWDCDVHELFQNENLGCKKGPVAAIDWFFKNVESGIILEDDCLPDPTFFRYCGELLEHYKNEEKVMLIGGNNYQFGRKRGNDSYYFSVFGHIWGWASWRRAWQHNDADLSTWPEVRKTNWIQQFLLTKDGALAYSNNLEKIYNSELDAWDYVWSYSRWRQNGLSIVPNCNLVTNIGFDIRATHTRKKNRNTSIPAEPMLFPIKHPKKISINRKADLFTVNHLYLGYPLPEDVGYISSLYVRIRKKVPAFIRKITDRFFKYRK